MLRFRFILILVALVFFSFVGFFSIWRLLLEEKYQVDESMDEVHYYKYFQINPSKNATLRGFVSLSQHLDESISYQTNANHYIISNFGTEEYRCHGSCYCNEEDSKRRGVFLRGFYHILSLYGLYILSKDVRDYFREKCLEEIMESECSGEIESEVDSCERIITEEGKIEKAEPEKYFCKGRCETRMFLISEKKRKVARDFKCWKLEFESEIVVTKKMKDAFRIYQPPSNVEMMFIHGFFGSFCEENSKVMMKGWTQMESEKSVCSALSEEKQVRDRARLGFAKYGGDAQFFQNDNIECHPYSPK